MGNNKEISNKQVTVMAKAWINSSIILIYLINWCDNGSFGLPASPQVITPLGKITGMQMVSRRGRNINAFLGIPFAQPPIGPLRFKNPEPVKPWIGNLMAINEVPVCGQRDEYENFLMGQEDCLYLNVYSPNINQEENLLPTMVYIHGGAFQRGDAKPESLGPNYLLDKDIVLITVQYRLGVTGFLSTGDASAPGNFGLKDQALALKWVQKNIKYFGGSSDNVTLFGQSAGSVSVNYQALSKTTKGLFHRYITQSGSSLCPWSFANSTSYKSYAYKLGAIFECPNTTSQELIECLRQVPYYSLFTDDIFGGIQQLALVTWVPTVEPDIEGAFITEHPLQIILSDKIQDLPNISGAVKNEGLVLTTVLYANETLYHEKVGDVNELLHFVTSSYVTGGDADKLANNLFNFYFDGIDLDDKNQVLQKLTDLIGDISFLFPEMLQLQLVSNRMKQPSYFYTFEYRGTFSKTSLLLENNDNIGVIHADELIYLFPFTPEYFRLPDLEMSQEDEKMIDILVDLWTSFAIYGEPRTNFNGDKSMWKPYSDNFFHLQIGSENEPVLLKNHHFLDGRMHFWAMEILKILLF
ncbi:GSCOCT00007599001.2-RA-CDS [Cotesia congregata]|uniref:Carboxylic ester hydrolase n=1 Tax=Cotesia congregata TaxID=51543 RepID=A0A8J2HIP9_COTCN|nr:GSCOCT00007599001.2-RA-CDS [Cotesia congregata]CAG5097071.1 carboxylesterase clade F member 3 [Cotesia congregata]